MALDIMRFITRQTSRCSYTLRHYTRGLALAKKELDHVRQMTRDELLEFQDMKLRRLIQHCRENVPFYREWFEGRDFPADTLIRESEAWRDLPVLRKEDIQTNGNLLIATNARRGKMYKNATGGSTGEPLQFWQDDNYLRHNLIDRYRSYDMCGWQPGDRVVHLWGAEIDAAEHEGLRAFLVDRLVYNRLFINTFRLESREIEQHVREISDFAPALVVGYASSLDLFADAIESSGAHIRPTGVQSSADMLAPKARESIERAFNAPVFDRYGCRECGIIAHECEFHAGLHIFSNTQLVEILDDEGRHVSAGEMGNLAVTNLGNYAMPLIRYAVGDVAALTDQECECGRVLPLIAELGGRNTATLQSGSGTRVHGHYFFHLFDDIEGVKRFQVIQHVASQIEMRIALYPGHDREQVTAHLRRTMARQLGNEFTLEINFDKEFEVQSSGKREYIISRVPTSQ